MSNEAKIDVYESINRIDLNFGWGPFETYEYNALVRGLNQYNDLIDKQQNPNTKTVRKPETSWQRKPYYTRTDFVKPKITPTRVDRIIASVETAGFHVQAPSIRNALAECFDIIGQDTPSRRRGR